ncbi:membrane protein [Labrys miyagiensis]|uniref:Membrane protein n=2 Tax=Labrys miyagiensis TaxID=346912 RepID=A0ABQ6CHT9_9HYPH|nr:membrane protein [Labrys miyagiensis]
MQPTEPVSPSISAFSWTGFYAGANIGGTWADYKNRLYTPGGGFPFFITRDARAISAAGTGSSNSSGVIGGLQAGYNYQWNSWVFGVEADISATSLDTSRRNRFTTPGAGAGTHSISEQTPWLATVRPRVGYSFGQIMLYATGGLAIVQAKVKETTSIPVGISQSGPDLFSQSDVIAGWTAGGGVEYAFDNHWSIKAEYLYVGLNYSDISQAKSPFFGNNTLIPYRHSFDDHINIARVGVNYRF